jgi:hypothetical protein
MFHDRLNEQIRNVTSLVNRRNMEDSEANPAMQEIVKQISMLGLSLQSFEKENISKVERNQHQIDQSNTQLHMIKNVISQMKQDIEQSVLRQDEAEQSFLQSFQDIKGIVLTKLSVFDKQIENKEDYDQIR